MSQRGKRQPNRTDDGPAPTKRRKCRPTPTPTPAEDEEVATLAAPPATTADDAAAAAQTGTGWTPKPLNDLKISSIYNRCASEAPAEIEKWFPRGSFWFLQDEHPLTQLNLFKFLVDNTAPVLAWPGNSSDMNLIENVWSVLKKTIAKEEITNRTCLVEKIKWLRGEKELKDVAK